MSTGGINVGEKEMINGLGEGGTFSILFLLVVWRLNLLVCILF